MEIFNCIFFKKILESSTTLSCTRELWTSYWRLMTVDWQLTTVDWQLTTVDWRLPTRQLRRRARLRHKQSQYAGRLCRWNIYILGLFRKWIFRGMWVKSHWKDGGGLCVLPQKRRRGEGFKSIVWSRKATSLDVGMRKLVGKNWFFYRKTTLAFFCWIKGSCRTRVGPA